MKKVLFLIHDLGQGGAEKVLVNLVNNMNKTKYDISVTVLFGGGVNEQFLDKSIHFHAVFYKSFRGNSQIFKLFTPQQLHRLCVKEDYDIEISYLEGPSARVISGCPNPNTTLISWIHVELTNMNSVKYAFRSEKEARWCYSRFAQIICVSEDVKSGFEHLIKTDKECMVLYNTVDSKTIRKKSSEFADEIIHDDRTNLIVVGSLNKSKGYLRLFSIVKRLHIEGYRFRLYVLGTGPLKEQLVKYIRENNLDEVIRFLGYDTNPYKYVAQCDLFICASYSEGFSTAATEALIVGTPVCTVRVSGMYVLLGDNEGGMITENSKKALEDGIRYLLDHPERIGEMKEKASIRGEYFSMERTVSAVEEMIDSITS